MMCSHIMLAHVSCALLGLFGLCLADPFSVVAMDRVGFTFNEKVEIMRQLNNYRRNVGASNMQQMFWHWGLEYLAQNWTDGCDYKHNRDRHRIEGFEYRYVGENIYMTWPWHNASDPHKEWYDEIHNFFPNGTCMEGYPCGHYAQMMWHDTVAVACGLRFCDRGTPINGAFYVVCDYGPLGNKPNRPVFLRGEACSLCPSGMECKDKLCTPPNCNDVTCQNGGVLLQDVCMCNCTGTQYYGESCGRGGNKDGGLPPMDNAAGETTRERNAILTLFLCIQIFFMAVNFRLLDL